MKHVDYSSKEWEDRVYALLASHPDTVTVVDARHLDHSARHGIDGLWRLRDEDRAFEVPFAVYVAEPEMNLVRFELEVLHGTDREPGAALSEHVRLIFICSPLSHSMMSIPGHALREFLTKHAAEFERSATSVSKADVKGTRVSERVLVPLEMLSRIPEVTISSPESW
jgi:hypothetical protein